jgi:hypothetical protein
MTPRVLFPKNLVARRKNETYVGGIMQTGVLTNVPFVGSIQPLSNRDAVALNIGRHDLGKVLVFSDRQLQETKKGTTLTGDLIDYGGQDYELIQENTHSGTLLPHWTYTAELRS